MRDIITLLGAITVLLIAGFLASSGYNRCYDDEGVITQDYYGYRCHKN